MKEEEEDKMRDHVVNRIVGLASTAHAEDMQSAAAVLQEYFSREEDDEHFVSDGDEGTFDTGFGMLVFAGTMAALFSGTQEVLSSIAGLPRASRRRLDKVHETIKQRHMKQLREIGDGHHDDQPE